MRATARRMASVSSKPYDRRSCAAMCPSSSRAAISCVIIGALKPASDVRCTQAARKGPSRPIMYPIRSAGASTFDNVPIS